MSDRKIMPHKDFQTLGFIQEVNRRLLHPCGLHMELGVGPCLGESALVIVDKREAPEGCYFEEQELSRGKAQNVVDLFLARLRSRREVFGHIIQPVPDYVDNGDVG